VRSLAEGAADHEDLQQRSQYCAPKGSREQRGSTPSAPVKKTWKDKQKICPDEPAKSKQISFFRRRKSDSISIEGYSPHHDKEFLDSMRCSPERK